MTRQTAIEFIKVMKSEEGRVQAIETIYDSLESRKCLNCKHFEDIGKSFNQCEIFDICFGDDFCCNGWVGK